MSTFVQLLALTMLWPLVSPAGNGNGLLLRGPNGHYIVATDAGHTRLASG